MSDVFDDRDLELLASVLPHVLPQARPSAAVRAAVLVATQAEPQSATPFHFVGRDEGWRPHPVPGITFKVLAVDSRTGVATLLVRAEPGTTYPEHHHTGSEGCYVLEGEVFVAGRRIGPGDFHLADADSDHDPLTTATGATVLLVCAAADYL
jgi:anti-sigma factor ChrR (cupin superfamily)